MNQRILALSLCLTLAWAVPVGGEAGQTMYVACYGIFEGKDGSGQRYYDTLTTKTLAAPFPITAKEAQVLWELYLTEGGPNDGRLRYRLFLDKTGCTVKKSMLAARVEVAKMLEERTKIGRFGRGFRIEQDWINNF